MPLHLTDNADASPAQHSRFFQRLHRRYGAQLATLPAGAPVRASMERLLPTLPREATIRASLQGRGALIQTR